MLSSRRKCYRILDNILWVAEASKCLTHKSHIYLLSALRMNLCKYVMGGEREREREGRSVVKLGFWIRIFMRTPKSIRSYACQRKHASRYNVTVAVKNQSQNILCAIANERGGNERIRKWLCWIFLKRKIAIYHSRAITADFTFEYL